MTKVQQAKPVGHPPKKDLTLTGPGLLDYKAGTLPENFHKRVVDMEIQLAIRGKQAADEAYAAQILELMGLYSVSFLILNCAGRHRVLQQRAGRTKPNFLHRKDEQSQWLDQRCTR